MRIVLIFLKVNFKPWNVKRRTQCFSEEFCTSAMNEDGTLSVYKSSSMQSIWDPPLIFSLTPCRSTNRFPLSLTALLLRQISIRAFAKDLTKTGNIAGLLEPIKNGKKVIPMNRWKNCSTRWAGLGREQKTSKTTKDDPVLPLSRRGRGNQRQLASIITFCPFKKSIKESSILS